MTVGCVHDGVAQYARGEFLDDDNHAVSGTVRDVSRVCRPAPKGQGPALKAFAESIKLAQGDARSPGAYRPVGFACNHARPSAHKILMGTSGDQVRMQD
jgi:hypothetical protein